MFLKSLNKKLSGLSEATFKEKIMTLPPIEEYKNGVNNFLLRREMSSMTPSEIGLEFDRAAIIYPQMVHKIDPNAMKNYRLYRVRLIRPGKPSIEEKIVRAFSYPDPSLCLENGRANIKGRTVFYAGDDWATALRELTPEPGSIAYISIWGIKCDREILYRGFLPYKSIPKESRNYGIAKSHFDAFQEFNSVNGIDKVEHMEYIYNCITEMFTFEHKNYWFSSWMANDLIYNYSGIDFLMYPSWKTQFTGTNFAIHPNFVDQFLKLLYVFKLEVKEISDSSFKYNMLLIGSVDQTNISWRSLKDEDIMILNRDNLKMYDVKIKTVNNESTI